MLLGLIAGLLTASAVSFAQESAKRIAFMATGTCPTAGASQAATASAIAHLEQLGWKAGSGMVVDCTAMAGRLHEIPAVAAEIVARRPQVIVADSTPYVRALKAATTSIPIVMAGTSDALREGLVSNLARPERNVTGFTHTGIELFAKRMELLRELVPGMKRIAIVWRDGGDAGYREALAREADRLAAEQSLSWQAFAAGNASDFEPIFSRIAAEGFDGVYLVPSPLAFTNRAVVIQLAIRFKLATISDLHWFARDGLLASYGPDTSGDPERIARYVDRLLRGATAADLPVEQPAKYHLVLNQRTASMLGIRLAPSVLYRADEVIR